MGRLGFGVGGGTVNQISQIMVTHFTAVHTLEITRIIAALLIYIQPTKHLEEPVRNRLIHVYRQLIE